MIRAAILFFVLALVALLFGMNGVAGLSMEIGKFIVLVFIAISVLTFIAALAATRSVKRN